MHGLWSGARESEKNIAEMTNWVQAWKEHQTDTTRVSEEAVCGAVETERRVAELGEKMKDLQAHNMVRGHGSKVPDAAELVRLERALQKSWDNLVEAQSKHLQMKEKLIKQQHCIATDREAILQQPKLDCYRASGGVTEVERIWEVFVQQLGSGREGTED